MSDGEIGPVDDTSVVMETECKHMVSQLSDVVSVKWEVPAGQVNQEVENLSSRIAEFVEVVENIRSDTKISVNTTLPLITEKALKLEDTFQRIDVLEEMVSGIDKTLTELEQQADYAESHLNSFASFKKKFLGALSNIGRRHQDTSPQYQRANPASGLSRSQYQPAEIFNAQNYLKPPPSTIPSS